MKEKLSIVASLFGGIILMSSCGGGYSGTGGGGHNPQNVHIVSNPSEMGSKGEGTYINSNSTYKDRDGYTWHRDNIFAPRAHESMNDESYKERVGRNNYSNNNQFENIAVR